MFIVYVKLKFSPNWSIGAQNHSCTNNNDDASDIYTYLKITDTLIISEVYLEV